MILKQRFHTVLLIASIAVASVAALEYLFLDELLVPAFVGSALLLLLSWAARTWTRPVAGVSIFLSFALPLGALIGFLRGELVLAIPIFDFLLFSWVFANAVHTLRSEGAVPKKMGLVFRSARTAGLMAVAAIVLLAAAYPFRADPIAMLPGKQFSGEEKAYPADWAFAQESLTLKIETNPDDPHSVTTLHFIIDDKLHIPAQNGHTKEWASIVVADPRVRIKIGDDIFPAQATLVSKDAGEMIRPLAVERFRQAGREFPEELLPDMWLFEISPRG